MTQPLSHRTFSSVILAIFALTTVSYGQSNQAAQNPAQTPSTSKAAGPVTMTECEESNNCATWTFLGTQGNGQWPSGEIANLNVESVDTTTVVIRRADSTGAAAGLTALYKGTRNGDRIEGEVTSSWPGHWNSMSANWYATLGKAALSPPPVMRVCDPAGICGTWTWNNGHYDGFWSVGGPPGGQSPVTATLTVVRFSPESVAINRTDTSPAPRVGYTYVYTGKISSQGDRIVNGDWSGQGGSGHFNATWGAALQELPATVPVQSQVRVVIPVLCYPWFFGVVCQ